MFNANELFCLSPKIRELELFGGWQSGVNYRALDIQLVPCSSSYVDYDGAVNFDDESCVWGLDKAMDYLGTALTSIMITNQGIFQPNEFDDERILKQSMVHSQLTSTDRAQWVGAFIRRQEL